MLIIGGDERARLIAGQPALFRRKIITTPLLCLHVPTCVFVTQEAQPSQLLSVLVHGAQLFPEATTPQEMLDHLYFPSSNDYRVQSAWETFKVIIIRGMRCWLTCYETRISNFIPI